eukprot:s4633_g3.t1
MGRPHSPDLPQLLDTGSYRLYSLARPEGRPPGFASVEARILLPALEELVEKALLSTCFRYREHEGPSRTGFIQSSSEC